MKVISILLPMVLALVSSAAAATTAIFDVKISSQFDYVTNTYEPLSVPERISVGVQFPDEVYSATDYGATTIVQFGAFGETKINYPILEYVGTDPYGDGLASLGRSAYTFPNTSDYSSTFIEQFAFQDTIYHSQGDRFWTFHSEIRVTRRSPPLSGIGDSDYAFTPKSLTAFLQDFMANPERYEAYFNQSWQHFERDPTGITGGTSLAGKSWSGYGDIRLVGLSTTGAVPEPSTWGMMLLGFGFVGGAMRAAKRRQKLTLSCI